jgi:acyl transferase domain-containing protein
MSEQHDTLNDIAVIGMDARVPGAANVNEFWEVLRGGVETTKFDGDPQVLGPGAAHVKAAPLLDGVDMFDAQFFNVNPREAEMMDPQVRLFLETAWTALESANCDPKQFNGRIGVYGSAQPSSYLTMNLQKNADMMSGGGGGPSTLVLLNDRDSVSLLASYKLDLTGPSITVQTFCSSSLVAVHLACQSLLNGESDVALAGGVTINLGLKYGYVYLEGGMLSADGHTRSFDERAGGTVFGNGVGIVVLKRLNDAIADGDTVHAVIRGTAINNDGAQKGGYTAPSVIGQSKAIAEAMAIAQVHPETIGYVEAHGTATAIGDPIEVEALTRAFRSGTQKTGYCGLGSVKTNFGHLDRAAGVISLIKTVLSLEHAQIPASLHFEKPNPRIDFENSPFRVNTTLKDWTTDGGPRRAGVSALGVGGTNAHAILEEAPEREPSGPSRPSQLLVISARTESALGKATEQLIAHLKANPAENLADIANTLRIGRRRFEHRRIVACSSVPEAIEMLEALRAQKVFTAYSQAASRPVVFMFSGQGSQYVNMTRGLYESEPVYKQHLDDCCVRLKPHLGVDLRDLIFCEAGKEPAAAERLNQTAIAQPALFAVEYSLAQLWMAWGIKPQAMLGHSVGEYVAAQLAGVLSLDDALALVAERGRLMQALPGGSMLAVPMPIADVEPLVREPLSIAAVNGPALCVVSGPTPEIQALEELLQQRDVPCTRLHTSHAFHSSMMTPMLGEFEQRLRRTTLNAPTIPYVSNLTGTWITGDQATDPKYWTDHLRQAVRFSDGVRTLWSDPDRILLEVGPGSTLSGLAKQHAAPNGPEVTLSTTRHPRDVQNDLWYALTALGRLWIAGANPDWNAFVEGEARNRVTLPTYPYERERYWVEPTPQSDTRQRVVGKNPDVSNWFYVPAWRSSPPLQSFDRAQQADAAGAWLVFIERNAWSSKLVDTLRRRGQSVVTVEPGDRFGGNASDGYIIDPTAKADYERVLAEVAERGAPIGRLVHAWAVAAQDDRALTPELFSLAQRTRFYSVLHLAKALGRVQAETAIPLKVVTSGLVDVAKGEAMSPENAPLLALSKVIPQEHQQIVCTTIDLESPASPNWNDRAFDRVSDELAADAPGAVVAYRGGQRWVQSFDSMRLPQPAGIGALRDQGVYLIIGGLGGVGFALASYLAKAARAKLVLTGRSALPGRGSWKVWLDSRGADDVTSIRIRRVKALEEMGAEVLVAAADANDRESMNALIRQTEQKFGTLHGVIYAAGLVGGGTFRALQDLELNDCERQFAPKIAGLMNLDDVLGDRPLDFCLLTSSLSSVLGGLGYAAYSAGNLFEDAYTRSRNQRRATPWISVNWDEWRLTEAPETGGAKGLAQYAMKPMEGGEAFGRLLALRGVDQIVVSTGDLQARIDQWIKLETIHAAKAAQVKEAPRRHSRPNLQNAYVAPGTPTEEKISEVWRQLLGIEEIGIHDNFFELGGHSMLGIQLVARIKGECRADISVASLFEGPTVHSLSLIVEAREAGVSDKFDQSSDRGRRRKERSRERHEETEETTSEVVT